jgi:tetratricopeptide (TPR) repeat protein
VQGALSVIKSFFGKKKAEPEQSKDLSIEDLVTLERYEEAAELLRQRVKAVPKDLHAHLKLAEVYVSLKSANKALDEFVYVADMLAEDGFLEKGMALLTKAAKLAPGDDMIPRRLEKYKHMKELEARRVLAIEGLLSNKTTGIHSAANSKMQVELLWNKIAKSHLVQRLEAEPLKKLFSVMQMAELKAGEIIARAGEVLPLIFLIVDGQVDVEAEIGLQRFNVRNFTTGHLIGDSALLENRAWPAEYKVTRPGTVFKLDRDGLQIAMTGNADPREFLNVLRQQGNDRDVAANIQRLRTS